MKDKWNPTGEDWYRWIYNFNFSDAFLAVLRACNIEYPELCLSSWKINQENIDMFEAEVFVLNYYGKLE